MLVSLVIKNIICHSVIKYSYTRGPSTNKFSKNFSKKIWRIKNNVYLCNPKRKREHSSAGLEHLPYKQGVTGSNPVAPTILRSQNKFFIVYFKCFGGLHN